MNSLTDKQEDELTAILDNISVLSSMKIYNFRDDTKYSIYELNHNNVMNYVNKYLNGDITEFISYLKGDIDGFYLGDEQGYFQFCEGLMYDYIIIGTLDDFRTISNYDLFPIIENKYEKILNIDDPDFDELKLWISRNLL